jgi:predicted LPLAT superfamily acyltransferase
MATARKTTPVQADSKTAWAHNQERGNMAALKLMSWIALHLGRRFSRAVLWFVMLYFYLSSSSARNASREFLSRIPGQTTGRAAVFRHLYAFGAVTLDRIYFLNGRLDLFNISVNDTHNLALGTASSGAGMFLMGAHLGSFECVRSIARDHPQLKMVLLMYEENARNIKQLLSAINPEAQQDIISLGRPGAMLAVKEQLAKGALIGVLADRSLDDTGNVQVSLLGSPAAFPSGPFRMAAMLGHPVFFMTGTYHGGNRYTIHLDLIINAASIAANREQASQRALERYVQLIEQHCVAEPYNWFNFFDFWQTSPHKP